LTCIKCCTKITNTSRLKQHYLASIGNLRSDAESSDILICAGEEPNLETFHAHAAILQAISPYFKAALSERWSKSNGIKFTKPFTKPNVEPGVFKILLEYVLMIIIVSMCSEFTKVDSWCYEIPLATCIQGQYA
jgi:hypothetical protein